MTAMRGSGTPTALPEPGYVVRFTAAERALHWVHATAFVALLGTGLALYVPALAARVGDRPLVKNMHLVVAVAWLAGLALVALLGDRGALRRSLREIDRFDADDLRWLTGRPAPQGRFNAGQKAHAVVQAAFAVLFTISGVLLWLGERDTRLRFAGTIPLHDSLMFAAAALVAGHLWLALAWPRTRPALRGITLGTVRADWARAHHAKWTSAPRRGRRP